VVTRITKFVASDGKEFNNEADALHYENRDEIKKAENYNKFFATYGSKDLLKNHSLDEEGLWEVFGEDPNCDLGGYHREPSLGIYEGKLEDVIRTAVTLPGFWQWGSGGRIRSIKVEKPTIIKV